MEKKKKIGKRSTNGQTERIAFLAAKLRCCHGTDGLLGFFCTMMTVALAGGEQPDLNSAHYVRVCACMCVHFFFVGLSHSMFKMSLCRQQNRKHTRVHTQSMMIKPVHNSIQSSNRIFSTLQESGYLELQGPNGYS